MGETLDFLEVFLSGNVDEVGWEVHLKSGELMAGESGDGMGLWKRIKQEMLS
jgi:hypothetical protein